MRHEEILGALSSALVFASSIPYYYNAIKGTISLHAVSWSLWTLIGIAMFVTYMGSGAKESLWPVAFSILNPGLVLGIILYKKRKAGAKFSFSSMVTAFTDLDLLSKLCLALCIAALAVYVVVRDNKDTVEFALFISLAADLCAAIPTLKMVRGDPTKDKPGPWILYVIGYLFALASISETSIESYSLPLWMVVVYSPIAIITGRHLIKIRAPLQEWFI